MAERRHYPEAAIIHVPHCVEGQELPALPIGSVAESLPNYRLHFCFPLEWVDKPIAEIARIGIVPMVTWETPDYGPHTYVPDRSGRWPLPPDAIDFPCRVCRGTHGAELEKLLGASTRQRSR
ncbi:hypothetical protein [Actinoplanes subtropicus]|uniref:hypothetical protein n=1 Tax=Actinoplanes subtropicus TaxID=543632 RepID=UPI0004C3950B|nr:hypothetical protein [Actinoplanes subtropicus]